MFLVQYVQKWCCITSKTILSHLPIMPAKPAGNSGPALAGLATTDNGQQQTER